MSRGFHEKKAASSFCLMFASRERAQSRANPGGRFQTLNKLAKTVSCLGFALSSGIP
jgi:hypothetical protein